MLFCSHNEVDLTPDILTLADSSGRKADWIVVRCTCCKQIIGKRRRLVDLVDQAAKVYLEEQEE